MTLFFSWCVQLNHLAHNIQYCSWKRGRSLRNAIKERNISNNIGCRRQWPDVRGPLCESLASRCKAHPNKVEHYCARARQRWCVCVCLQLCTSQNDDNISKGAGERRRISQRFNSNLLWCVAASCNLAWLNMVKWLSVVSPSHLSHSGLCHPQTAGIPR